MSKKFNDKTVILITIDALRADHLKSYGYTRNTAPYLENYFERGLLFLEKKPRASAKVYLLHFHLSLLQYYPF